MKRTPLARRTPDDPKAKPLKRTTMRRGTTPLRRTRLRAVSSRRVAENRLRRKNLTAVYGTDPMCVYPGCQRRADDAHELLSRARGGSITDPTNVVPLCRPHHDEITTEPLVAARLGLSLSQFGAVL